MFSPAMPFRAVLLASALLCASLPLAAQERLLIDSPDALWPVWQALQAAHPLPAGVTAERAGPDAPSGAPRLVLTLNPVPDSRVIARIALAPVGILGDARDSATLAQVRAGAVRTAPVASIALPEVALPVDGRYPGDPDYPLDADLHATLTGPRGAARSWFEGLPTATDESGGSLPAEGVTWIGAVGDIMPARGVDAALLSAGGAERVFGDTLPVLRAFGMLLGNLEAAATQSGVRANKSYTFRFDSRAIPTLVSAGFSYLSLTNNHTFDYGATGFLDTLAAVRAAGAATSGVGANQDAAAQPYTARLGDVEVRILSFADYPVDQTGFDGRKVAMATPERPGMLWLDSKGLQIAAGAFRQGALNIAMVHGGREWSRVPTSEQRTLYRALVDAGANVVIGSHPHVLEGLEAYHGGLIAYSVGNFLFPGMQGTNGGEDSVILRLGVSLGAVRYVEYTPVRLSGITVRLDPRDSTLRALRASTRALRPPE